MAPDLFSARWTNTLCETLNASATYREAAAAWEGDVLFIAQTDAEPLQVYLDLHHGACRAALSGPAAATREAAFAIDAPLDVWKRVLSGALDPIMGMMLGKLTLRGNMAVVAANAGAAKALVACAASVDAS